MPKLAEELPPGIGEAAVETFTNWLSNTFASVSGLSEDEARQHILGVEIINYTCGRKVNLWAHVSPELHQATEVPENEALFGTTKIEFKDPRSRKRIKWSIGERDYDPR
ncbi:MAG: hypothetical protein EOM20_14855 [Spartobacteria bacterium]|nr:hypothetical protein [Spartobacteria bacterium]